MLELERRTAIVIRENSIIEIIICGKREMNIIMESDAIYRS